MKSSRPADPNKITIWCTNNANVHSTRYEDVPLTELGLTREQWDALDEDAKFDAVNKWINEAGWIENWFTETNDGDRR